MRAASFAGAALLAVIAGGAAWSQAQTADQALRQAVADSYQVREGRYEVAPKSVAMLEAALQADPENSQLLTALAIAQFQMASYTGNQPGGSVAQAFPSIQKGAAAYEKAAAVDPKNAKALSGRGATRTLLGRFTGNTQMVASGVADMNAAAAMDQVNTTVRLNRAFFGVNVAPDLRDDKGVETDIRHLMTIGNPRERDVLHLLLGDLYAETGKGDLAKAEYTAADRTGSTVADKAKGRLAALSSSGVPAADINDLRSQLGSNCVMCHGS